MYQGDVLRCTQCNKPFDKRMWVSIIHQFRLIDTGFSESTLKRHGYYCRSRKLGSTTRLRACVSCVRAKTRCDNRRPECSRCAANAVECHYPTSIKSRDPKPIAQNNYNDSLERQRVSLPLLADIPSAENGAETSNNDDILLALSDTEFATFDQQNLDWNYPEINFSEFLGFQGNGKRVQNPSSEPSVLNRQSTAQINRVQEFPFSPDISMPTQPTGAPRSLVLRTGIKDSAQRTASLMFNTLKSYPLMILRHKTLPPFIHSHLISSNAENLNMEPLNNCLSLLHMISSGVQGSRKLFWKNVRLECERLCESVR